jgi:hypothetical protein
MMQVMYKTSSLSDVGCTFRLIKKSSLLKMQPHFRVKSGFFGPEMMLLSRKAKMRFVQIPIKYKARVGESGYTGTFIKAFKLGMNMIWFIVTFPLRGYKITQVDNPSVD